MKLGIQIHGVDRVGHSLENSLRNLANQSCRKCWQAAKQQVSTNKGIGASLEPSPEVSSTTAHLAISICFVRQIPR